MYVHCMYVCIRIKVALTFLLCFDTERQHYKFCKGEQSAVRKNLFKEYECIKNIHISRYRNGQMAELAQCGCIHNKHMYVMI